MLNLLTFIPELRQSQCQTHGGGRNLLTRLKYVMIIVCIYYYLLRADGRQDRTGTRPFLRPTLSVAENAPTSISTASSRLIWGLRGHLTPDGFYSNTARGVRFCPAYRSLLFSIVRHIILVHYLLFLHRELLFVSCVGP